MGRKLKELQLLKMSRGQSSPVLFCASPEETPSSRTNPPDVKKKRKVPPLKIRIKPADQIHSSPKKVLKSKTQKPVVLNEKPLPLKLVDLKHTGGVSGNRSFCNAWATPLLQQAHPKQLSVSDDDLSDALVVDEDVQDEIYQSDFNATPTPLVLRRVDDVHSPTVRFSPAETGPEKVKEGKEETGGWDPTMSSPPAKASPEKPIGEKEKSFNKTVGWDLSVRNFERKRSAQISNRSATPKNPRIQFSSSCSECPPCAACTCTPCTAPMGWQVTPAAPPSQAMTWQSTPAAPPSTPTEVSPTLQLLRDAADPLGNQHATKASQSSHSIPVPPLELSTKQRLSPVHSQYLRPEKVCQVSPFQSKKVHFVQVGKLADPVIEGRNESRRPAGLVDSMKLLEEMGKLPRLVDTPATQDMHQATSLAFGRLNEQIQNLSYQLQTIQKQPITQLQVDKYPNFTSEYIPHLHHQTTWTSPWNRELTSSTQPSPWTTTTSWARSPSTLPTVPGWHQAMASTATTNSGSHPQSRPSLPILSTHPHHKMSVLLDHTKAQWTNIQQDRILQSQQSGPTGLNLPQLFECQYEIAPELKAYGRNHHLASWTLSLQETRRSDVIYGFTVRLTAILLEALRKSPDFGHLQGLDSLDWNVQASFLSRVLRPFMQVRSLAGLVSFFTSKYGKEDHLTKTMFEIWAQFQLSKLSHPFSPTSQKQYQPTITEALLTFPKTATNLAGEYFAPLPVLPARESLWYTLTHKLDCGRTPVEAIAFLTWVAIHDQHLGRALVAPLFELGQFTHTWAYTFEPHHICMAPAGPQIETPRVVRILRICAMFIASKVLQVSLTNQYPTGINTTGQVFLPLSKQEASKQCLTSDLILNKENIQFTGSITFLLKSSITFLTLGWSEDAWYKMFGTKAKVDAYYDQLTHLKLGSLFHLSRPVAGFSPTAWHDLRPTQDLDAAHSYMIAREKYWENHLLSHAPLNFAESKFSQIVPSPALFWLKNAK